MMPTIYFVWARKKERKILFTKVLIKSAFTRFAINFDYSYASNQNGHFLSILIPFLILLLFLCLFIYRINQGPRSANIDLIFRPTITIIIIITSILEHLILWSHFLSSNAKKSLPLYEWQQQKIALLFWDKVKYMLIPYLVKMNLNWAINGWQ